MNIKMVLSLVVLDVVFRYLSLNLLYININKSAAGIACCPATALTSSEVTVLNLSMSSSHALYLYQVL